MGSTLEHGIYLPSEGEKNCYQGLAGNWNKVDGALGDVAELKQSIESKFTKEIVTELPTEDINPYCIYMILKTDPETDNVYDEWVYINNNWEYLGNTKVDMTQYYTKQEVNQLPAVASGVTATKVGNYDAHIANGDIHVTASDKAKWDTVALIKQLRLVNTQVGSATTIAFANIDDTNGIKVGDKCMDLDGRMFEITAVDTTNQTVTVGTALIDLALDANVVHTSGDETVGGQKIFANNRIIVGRNTDTGSAIQLVNSDVVGGSASGFSGLEVYGSSVSTDNKIGGVTIGEWSNNGGSYASIECNQTVSGVKISNAIRNLIRNDGSKEFSASIDNDCKLGHPYFRWSGVYATNYYYGANNVEFSTKFVTTDTNQTITGTKTFTDLLIYNSDTTAYASYLNLKNQRNARGSSETGVQGIQYQDKNGKSLTMLESRVISNGNTGFNILCYNTDGNNQSVSDGVSVIKSPTTTTFTPITDNAVTCGRTLAKWSDVQTYKINALEPSSLSLPSDRSARINISSYFIYTGNNATNDYSVLANGYIFLKLNNINHITCYSTDSSSITNYAQTYTRPSDGVLYITFPVRKNDNFRTIWNTGSSVSIENAYFIPCQGNV